jgi:hypothetical protein
MVNQSALLMPVPAECFRVILFRPMVARQSGKKWNNEESLIAPLTGEGKDIWTALKMPRGSQQAPSMDLDIQLLRSSAGPLPNAKQRSSVAVVKLREVIHVYLPRTSSG